MPLLVALLSLVALGLGGCAGPRAGRGPALLGSEAELEAALGAGRAVRVVIRYARCTLRGAEGERPGPDVVGGMTVTAFERFAAGAVGNAAPYLATSASQLIAHPRHGTVVNYVRLRVEASGKVEVTARYLRPPAMEVVMDETFTCAIDGGAGQGGVAFLAGR